VAWLEVSVRTSKDLAEQVSAAMESQQALAVTTQAALDPGRHLPSAENDIFEPEPGTTPLWSEVEVRGLFEENVSLDQVAGALMDAPGIDSPGQLSWQRIEDQVWERVWMDRFKPMRFGKRLWIVPTGMAAPKARGATVIRLDPGVAFGTGAHATTALCLDWLDTARLKGKFVVDYGCGSGVLAIAAALKGARRVIAVDNDPQALEACELNARRNHVNGQILTCLPEHYPALLSDTLRGVEGVDVMLANILARPLINLAPVLTDSLKTGGKLVLSGLLDSQSDSVGRAYRRAFGKLTVTRRDGWARLVGVRKA
jgi:ribosomal protein L11 methyltransferase